MTWPAGAMSLFDARSRVRARARSALGKENLVWRRRWEDWTSGFDVLMRRHMVCIEWGNVHARPSVPLVGKQDI
jgi:hypothetical protein